MANEVNTGLPAETAADALAAMAVRVFDPGELLAGPAHPAPRATVAVPPEDLPYVAGPTAEVVRTFDPAAYLGDAARRGPAMIGNGKPLVARIGGVEVVTIPLEHYAALLSPLGLARDQGETGTTVDGVGLMDIIMSLHAGNVISPDKGLDDAALGERVASWAAAQPQPWTIESVRDGVIMGTTDQGQRFTVTIVPKAPHSAVDLTPSVEEATVDLPSGISAVDLTPGEIAAAYDAAVQRGDTLGGAMDRHGLPSEPAGKGVAAIDAERGSAKRSRR